MSSSATRYQIVIRALAQAGRSVELRSQAENLLNDFLRALALEFKWPQLRKIGATLTLPISASTVALPTDLGAGMEGLVFGDERTPLDERSMQDFINMHGFPAVSDSARRPKSYYVDRQAGNFQFDGNADQAYTFIPIYFSVPAAIPQTPTGDNSTVWVDDDRLAIEGLIEKIYQFNGDDREKSQHGLVEEIKMNARRGVVAMTGGTARMSLSRAFRAPVPGANYNWWNR